MRVLASVSHLSWHPSFPFWWVPTYSLCKTQLQYPCFKKPSQKPSMEPTDIVNIQGSHPSRLLTPFPKGSAFPLLGLCDTLKRPGHSWENIWGLGIPLLKRKNSSSRPIGSNEAIWTPTIRPAGDLKKMGPTWLQTQQAPYAPWLHTGPSPHCGTMLPSYPEGWQLCPPSSEVKFPPTHLASVQTGWSTKARVL